MRGQYTVEELAEQMRQYLGCPCAYFPPMKDGKPVVEAYYQARERGKQEGFFPMLVVVDEILMECFQFNGEDSTRQELLSAPLELGRELLQTWRSEADEDMEDPSAREERMGEISGGEGIDSFLGLRDFSGSKTMPVLLAEIPAQNPWEVFAWLPFGGWNSCPANEEHMAVSKYWFESYGAVPALMTHDVLEYVLPAPVSREKSVELALEQYAYCADIVDQGVETVGRLADGLAQSTVWFFWWD